jgi:hypothetical protein
MLDYLIPVFMDYLFQRAERLKERNRGTAPIISGEGKSCLGRWLKQLTQRMLIIGKRMS